MYCLVVPFYWYANSILLHSQAVTSLPTVAVPAFFIREIFFSWISRGVPDPPPLDTALVLLLPLCSLCRCTIRIGAHILEAGALTDADCKTTSGSDWSILIGPFVPPRWIHHWWVWSHVASNNPSCSQLVTSSVIRRLVSMAPAIGVRWVYTLAAVLAITLLFSYYKRGCQIRNACYCKESSSRRSYFLWRILNIVDRDSMG